MNYVDKATMKRLLTQYENIWKEKIELFKLLVKDKYNQALKFEYQTCVTSLRVLEITAKKVAAYRLDDKVYVMRNKDGAMIIYKVGPTVFERWDDIVALSE